VSLRGTLLDDCIIGVGECGELLSGDVDELPRYTPRNQLVGLIVCYEHVVVALQFVIAD
jgi:hypothetical protein